MNNRDANFELMANWTQAWKTLGRWQALNSRLSRDATPLTSGWARRSSMTCRVPGITAAVSTHPRGIDTGPSTTTLQTVW
jgi:hypothetical protein